jgi:hypothetical protein
MATDRQRKLAADIALRHAFVDAVTAALAAAAQQGHNKPSDIAVYIRVEMDRRNLVVRRGRV